ncbi:MAG: uncharacterized protein KVP18_002292 [Porospora cf. gigantea A]|uniref:uncharacterized protein n=1 Tax=Porospora cf. gigantea A TaxID=2853593 RepID=UPI00355A4C0A|nr:MAG: hypothetical protein KVP18_002292 [Porospora cf. gigantea A]
MSLCDRYELDNLDALRCPVCMDVPVTPLITSCGHVFCRICIDRWASTSPLCPICKQSIGEVVPVKETTGSLRLLLQTGRVACMNEPCEWTGPLYDLDAHLQTCPWRVEPCPK